MHSAVKPQGVFEVWDAGKEDEYERWLAVWREWVGKEVFAHPDYVQLYANATTRALCAAMVVSGCPILYPFLLRDLTVEPYWGDLGARGADITTPYGYGGPFVAGDRAYAEKHSADFWTEFEAWATKTSVVSEFVRMSLFDEEMAPYPGVKRKLYDNIVRDLTLDEDALWMDFEHKVRKNVKRAVRSGVTVETDLKGTRLKDFLRIYYATMQRRRAKDSYYFPQKYFETIAEKLHGNYAFFHALSDENVVSTELVLVSEFSIYSFLGGTDEEAFELRPNDLLKYEIMRWGKANGKRTYVLGGGYEQDDGIFRFKRSFAPRGIRPYFIGYRVMNAEMYQALVANRASLERERGNAWDDAAGFFPLYRA
jgi:hypothetical protein